MKVNAYEEPVMEIQMLGEDDVIVTSPNYEGETDVN